MPRSFSPKSEGLKFSGNHSAVENLVSGIAGKNSRAS